MGCGIKPVNMRFGAVTASAAPDSDCIIATTARSFALASTSTVIVRPSHTSGKSFGSM